MKRKLIYGVFAIVGIIACISMVDTVSANKETTDKSQNLIAPLFVEDFTYADGSLLVNNNWTAHSGAGTNPLATSAPGLTFAGYPSSGVGNAVSMTVSGEDANRVFTPQTSGTVYVGVLANFSEAAIDAAGIGGYFFHLGGDPIGSTFRGRIYVKKDASNALAFGITKASTSVAGDISFTPFNYALNTTYLFVVKYTVVDGATNDTVSLTVNTTTPANEPAPTVSAPDVGATDIIPASVALRQGSAATAPTQRVDGIRVGTTWADITQATAPSDAPVDFNGDGRTDWVIARNTNVPANQLTWFWNLSGSANPTAFAQWGLSTDVLVPADYDGDLKDDIAVWRPGAALTAAFYIYNSATNTVRVEQFGQTGDDPSVVSDYNGDGKDDVAVFRPSNGTWYYRTAQNGPVTFVPWGQSGDTVAPGDYNGDGSADFGIRRNNGGSGNFWIRLSTGVVQPVVGFGLNTDNVITGDFDGDAKTDIATWRSSTGTWFWRPSSGGADQQATFGIASDIPTPGDYTGDGRTDIAVYRNGVFYMRSSSDGAITIFNLGTTGDRAPASYNSH